MAIFIKINLDDYLSSFTKFSTKWIKNLIIVSGTLTLTEKKGGYIFQRVGRNFLNRTWLVQALRPPINNQNS